MGAGVVFCALFYRLLKAHLLEEIVEAKETSDRAPTETDTYVVGEELLKEAKKVQTCKKCNERGVAPGLTKNDKPYDTCCKDCVRYHGNKHSPDCNARHARHD